MTTVASALAEGAAMLANCAEPRLEAMLLLRHVLQRPPAWMVSYRDSSLSPDAAQRFHSLCERRRIGIPAAYVIQSAGFYGHELYVDENVLVPRPETEHLVDEAITYIGGRALRVLDVGTGSGAIACAIAAGAPARVDATDISPEAITIARRNAIKTGVASKCTFYEGNLTEPVTDNRYDVVVANLPYVPTADIPEPPNPVAFEPRIATDGGPTGLEIYRRLLPQLPQILKHNSLVLLEAAPPTIDALLSTTKSFLIDFAISLHKDYAGLDRYIRAERNS